MPGYTRLVDEPDYSHYNALSRAVVFRRIQSQREEGIVAHLVSPHGRRLKPLMADAREIDEESTRAASLTALHLGTKEVSDLIMMAMGAFSPLYGFMTREDYLGTVEWMRLADGTLWPIPVTLPVSSEEALSIRQSQEVALLDNSTGELFGLMRVEDKFSYDLEKEAKEVFRTEDRAHPGVSKLYSQGEMYVGGPVKVLSEGSYPERFPEFARPAETRRIFLERGWSTVTAFQTRNPMHRSHEYLVKIALEVSDGVLLHPIVGQLKKGDIPAEVRMRCYKVMLEKYFPKESVVPKGLSYGNALRRAARSRATCYNTPELRL